MVSASNSKENEEEKKKKKKKKEEERGQRIKGHVRPVKRKQKKRKKGERKYYLIKLQEGRINKIYILRDGT